MTKQNNENQKNRPPNYKQTANKYTQLNPTNNS